MKPTSFVLLAVCTIASVSGFEGTGAPPGSYAVYDFSYSPKAVSRSRSTKGATTSGRSIAVSRSTEIYTGTNVDRSLYPQDENNRLFGFIGTAVTGITEIVAGTVTGVAGAITGAISGGIRGAMSGFMSSGFMSDILGSLTPKMLPVLVEKYVGTPSTVQPGLIQDLIASFSRSLKAADPSDIKDRMLNYTNTLASADPEQVIKNIQSYQSLLAELNSTSIQLFVNSYAPLVANISPDTIKSVSTSLLQTIDSPEFKATVKKVQTSFDQDRTFVSANITVILNSSIKFLKENSSKNNATIANTILSISNQFSNVTSKSIEGVVKSIGSVVSDISVDTIKLLTSGLTNFVKGLTVNSISGGIQQTYRSLDSIKPEAVERSIIGAVNGIASTGVNIIRRIFSSIGVSIYKISPYFIQSILSKVFIDSSVSNANRLIEGTKNLSDAVAKADDKTLVEARDKLLDLLLVAGKAV